MRGAWLPALLLLACSGRLVADDRVVVDEVVVTARKLPEPAFDVPLEIRVLSGRVLEESHVDGLYALAARVPGLSFESVWGGGVSLPTMRGQFSPSLGDTVGVFVDGVYQASRSALDVELLDFARAEVVFGPQSTLYGHSTFAGAIGYVSNRPSEDPSGGATVEAGSDDYTSLQGWVSGPLGDGWRGRIAAAGRSFDGTQVNVADGERPFGGLERRAVAASLASDRGWGVLESVALLLRYQDGEYAHPAAASVDGRDYNCGGQDRASGLWSYFCGRLPASADFDLSPGLPESTTGVGQATLQLVMRPGSLQVESETSYYAADSTMARDFDASSSGVVYGVCTVGRNCGGTPGLLRVVDRFVLVNEVVLDEQYLVQLNQELRVRGSAGVLQWMAGAAYFDSRDTVTSRFGAARGDLQAAERLTAVLPGSPLIVGPLSVANEGLVSDPNTYQSVRQRVRVDQRNLAVFGTADWRVADHVGLRAEVRAEWERFDLDSRVVNFQPSFGRAIPAQDFDVVTARLAAEYRLSDALRAYVSAANGSRPGGINPIPGLPPDEQVYDPESNWTYEFGLRHRSPDLRWTLGGTAYYIDWRDTQINGLSRRPGLTSLIVVNTAGVRTRGLQAAATLRPMPWLGAEFSFNYSAPEFVRGSDDFGSSAFCGLSAQNASSTFCTIGPPRESNPNSPPVVPWLDGNAPGRAPQLTWNAALTLGSSRPTGRWRPWGRLDASHQDEVYERQINGARFGERTLLDARLGMSREDWSVEAWATNLTDESYVRASFSRPPVFYPTQPRPLDFIYADGRRIGLTVRWSYR